MEQARLGAKDRHTREFSTGVSAQVILWWRSIDSAKGQPGQSIFRRWLRGSGTVMAAEDWARFSRLTTLRDSRTVVEGIMKDLAASANEAPTPRVLSIIVENCRNTATTTFRFKREDVEKQKSK